MLSPNKVSWKKNVQIMLIHLYKENKNNLEPDVNVKLRSVQVVETCVQEEAIGINLPAHLLHMHARTSRSSLFSKSWDLPIFWKQSEREPVLSFL